VTLHLAVTAGVLLWLHRSRPEDFPFVRAALKSVLQIRELGPGIHDLPGFDTSDFRSFAVQLDCHDTRLPIDRSAETLLLVVEGASRSSGAKRPLCRPSSA
jgi:hypothetical protein